MAANYRHKTGVCKAGETFLTHIVGWVVEKMCVRRENFLQKNPTRKFLMHSRFCNFVLKNFLPTSFFVPTTSIGCAEMIVISQLFKLASVL